MRPLLVTEEVAAGSVRMVIRRSTNGRIKINSFREAETFNSRGQRLRIEGV